VTKLDRNVVLNQRHPAFGRIVCSDERPVVWDGRLFARGAS
jgi:RES domain-containing protein